MIKRALIIVLNIMVISLCFAQSNTIYQDSVSGFYLTQSHEGFIGENYETLILQDKPSISLSEIKKVSQNFDMLGKPAVFIVLNDSGKEKLKNITTSYSGEPLVIYFGRKIILAPIMTSPITEGEMIISGNFTIQETDGMVNWLKSRIGN
tara:strand:- start:379 stop:828 length:450 start_codon:yes stop_codon:yes gene_type:complete